MVRDGKKVGLPQDEDLRWPRKPISAYLQFTRLVSNLSRPLSAAVANSLEFSIASHFKKNATSNQLLVA